jgi:hypothetical protein
LFFVLTFKIRKLSFMRKRNSHGPIERRWWC